jgi:hypothetical protein
MKKIIEHFGLDNQRRKFAEENLELQEAMIEYTQASRSVEGAPIEYVEQTLGPIRQHLISELADNFVMLGEFLEWFKIKNYEVEGAMRYKIGRTHAEIEKEKKKNDLSR